MSEPRFYEASLTKIMIMRQVFLFIGCFIFFLITAAQSPPAGENVVVRMRATPTPSTETPLFVVDGMLYDEFILKKIDPNDIESINILKDAASALTYCNGASRGVIVITTKTANQRVIKINDLLTHESLPGATIELAYQENGKDTSMFMKTDSLGCFITNKIVNNKEYEIKVSSVGYKTFSAHVNSKVTGRSYSVLLERNYSKLDEVVVTSYPAISCRSNTTCFLTRTQKRTVLKPDNLNQSVKIFPNPVTRSQKINIEFINENEQKITATLFSLVGKLISSKQYAALNGVNRFEYYLNSNLSAGIYIIQFTDPDDKLIKSEKLVIQ